MIKSRLVASVLWALSCFQIAGRIASWIFSTWKAHGRVKVGIELLLFQSQQCCWQCLAKCAQTLTNALAPTCLPWLSLHASKTIVGDNCVLFFVLFNPRSTPTYFTICTSYRILARRIRSVSDFLAPVAGRISSCIIAPWKYRAGLRLTSSSCYDSHGSVADRVWWRMSLPSSKWRRSVCHGFISMLSEQLCGNKERLIFVLFNPNRRHHVHHKW